MQSIPKKSKVYDHYVLNSEAWNQFQPRNDDIVISTSLKAGTTWLQAMVEQLIFQTQPMPDLPWKLSPWLDHRSLPVTQTLALLEAQAHRRCIKSHLPLDALPYFSEVKYIIVGRDGRDIFMSFWNHYSHCLPKVFKTYDAFLAPRKESSFSCPDNIHEFFAHWISKSYFPWENEGFPFWSPLYHLQSWWHYRHLPNILFVHFNDLLNDLDGELRRIAAFLEIPVHEPDWISLVDSMTFKAMKAHADDFVPRAGSFLKGGAQRFLYKGTNGRWRGILTDEELRQYEQAVLRQIDDPDARRWLESGNSSIANY